MKLKEIFNFKKKEAVYTGIGFAAASYFVWGMSDGILTSVLSWLNYLPVMIQGFLVNVPIIGTLDIKIVVAALAFFEGMIVYYFVKDYI